MLINNSSSISFKGVMPLRQILSTKKIFCLIINPGVLTAELCIEENINS